MHFGQILTFNIPQVCLAMVNEFILYGFVIFLIADESTLVEFGTVLLDYIIFDPCRLEVLCALRMYPADLLVLNH